MLSSTQLGTGVCGKIRQQKAVIGPFDCRTRILYSPEDGREPLRTEYNDACSIRPTWGDLVDKAGLVDFDLSDTKTAFSATTRQQVC